MGRLGWLLLAMVFGALGAACTVAAPTASTPHAPNRIAYVGGDDHIYVLAVEGGDPRRVDNLPGEAVRANEIRRSRQPTWSPDGSRLAFMRLRSGEGNAPGNAAMWVVQPDGSGLSRLWETRDQFPIYMSWSPDGSRLGLLVQEQGEIVLLLVDAAGNGQPRQIASGDGGPLYFSWSPDGSEILVHTGGSRRANARADLAFVGTDVQATRRTFGDLPADFRAPAWSLDGKQVAVVAEGPDNSALISVGDAQGSTRTRLASLNDEVSFLLSPDGGRLAFSSRVSADRIFYQGLEVIQRDGSDRVQVTDQPVMAFFWSPDGKKLAYAAADRQAQALVWYVADAAGKASKRVGAFVPSQEQLRLYLFFDQFAQSHATWTPDSRHLVYAGNPPGSGEARGSRVYLAPADGSSEPRVVADGALALLPAKAGAGK